MRKPEDYNRRYATGCRDAVVPSGLGVIVAQGTKSQSAADIACPGCRALVSLMYEGSHDWSTECEKCDLRVTAYVPHVGDEEAQARLAFSRISVRKLEETE